MATSGNHQVLPAVVVDTTPAAGSPVFSEQVEPVQGPAGSPTLQGVSPDPEFGGGPVHIGRNDALGPLPGGSPTQAGANESLGPFSGGSQILSDEAAAMAGNIQGRSNSGLAATAPGGLGVSVDGTPVSEREESNLVSGLGVTPVVTDDPGNNRADVGFTLEAEVMLDRRVVDLVAAGPEVLFSPVAPLLGITVTRVSVRTLTVTTPGVAPQISLEALAAGDVLTPTTITPTVADRVQSILANAESAFVLAAGSLTLVKDTLSTAAVYSVEVTTYGRAR